MPRTDVVKAIICKDGESALAVMILGDGTARISALKGRPRFSAEGFRVLANEIDKVIGKEPLDIEVGLDIGIEGIDR